MSQFTTLLNAERPFLTDGGMETWLFFQNGFSAPDFAAIMLIEDDRARPALNRYFDEFLAVAHSIGAGFVLDTNSWRGCVQWASRLGLSEAELLRLSARAVEFAQGVRERWRSRVPAILVNGVVGPAGDGYRPGEMLSAAAARRLHAPQIRVLAEAGVDMISAITMTHVGEAAGIAAEAQESGLPVVISFTVETDGKLPTGDALGEAIAAVDDATGGAPAYYMVNCAHPDHFREALTSGDDWTARIGGVRGNASRLSHEQLDLAEELDQGDPEEFGRLNAQLADVLPNLRVFGGCCGTDHRHIGCLARSLCTEAAV